MSPAPRIALAPEPGPAWLRDAIEAGGGHLVPLADCEAIIWADAHDPEHFIVEFHAHEFFVFPLPGLGRGGGLRDTP